jgi:anti-anti-sigma factor
MSADSWHYLPPSSPAPWSPSLQDRRCVTTISERSIGRVTILDIDGPITEETSDQFRGAVRPLVLRDRANVVINLRAVPYLDSAGLGEIVCAYTTATRMGGTLTLLHVTARVRQLLAITRLLAVFDVFDAEADAVGRVGAASTDDVQP